MLTSHRMTKLAGAAIAAGALGLGALVSAGAAAAASADAAFLGDVQNAGISYDSATSVIAVGHQVCSALDSGTAITTVIDEVATQNDIDDYQGALFVAAAAGAYCPEYVGHS
jgi:hypothetical protein